MKHDLVLEEAEHFWKQGFAIHWLLPRQKRPVDVGWTTGPRKSLDELKKTYRKGFNVGTRLGQASKISGKYLGVIDLDVKATEGNYLMEALEHVKKVIDTSVVPIVLSGRGNGSRHYYILTDKPIKPQVLFTSKDIVKVHMPSAVKPSKKELETLTTEEIKQGIRLRPACEVSLMGEGQQVVLPPSIHPDSGKNYKWTKKFNGHAEQYFVPMKNLEFIESASSAVDKVKSSANKANFKFEVDEPDIENLKMPNEVKKLLKTGEGSCGDKSSDVLTIGAHLLRAGLNRDQILSVLTNKEYFMSEVSYRHAETSNRNVAARWFDRYRYSKILARFNEIINLFEAPLPELDFDQVTEQEKIKEKKKIKFYIEGSKGGLTPDYNLLLEHFKNESPYKTISDMRSIYRYNGSHYDFMTPIEIKSFAEKNFFPKPVDKIRTEFVHKVFANEVVNRKFFTETTDGKINFKNGILDLNLPGFDRELKPHSPDFGFRAALPYAYEPEATCPQFFDWLMDIMLGDESLVKILQEFMGYAIRGGEYKYHKALWLGGVGRNGKSTFIDILKAVLGPGNYSSISIKSLVGSAFLGAELDGKFANFSEETSPEELKDSGPFKNLTGDGDIVAQKKYGDPFHFRNRAKLIMTYNQIPDLKDLSIGMLSRPLIVPFKKRISEEELDRNTKSNLLTELPGIFNFALEGWERLESQNGFTESAASTLALEKIKEESCNVTQWVKNFIVFDETNTVLEPRDLYSRYQKSERFTYKAPEFFRRLNKLPEIAKRKKRMTKGMVYFGLQIRS